MIISFSPKILLAQRVEGRIADWFAPPSTDQLFLENLLDLTDLLLNFAGDLFVLAFGFGVGIVGDLADLLFDRPLHLVDGSFQLVFCARFHL